MRLHAGPINPLVKLGFALDVFVSPNVPGVAPDHNARVFQSYEQMLQRLEHTR